MQWFYQSVTCPMLAGIWVPLIFSLCFAHYLYSLLSFLFHICGIKYFSSHGPNTYPEVSWKINISKSKECVCIYIHTHTHTHVAYYFWTTVYIFLVLFHNAYFPLKKKIWKELPNLSWNFHFKFKTDSQMSTGIYL